MQFTTMVLLCSCQKPDMCNMYILSVLWYIGQAFTENFGNQERHTFTR